MEHKKLSEDLQDLLNSATGKTISIQEIVHWAADRGFGLLLLMMSLPSALPIPAPGYSTPFGIVIILLAFQMILGKKEPSLPQWALTKKLSRSFVEKMIKAAQKFLRFAERFIRPRYRWIHSSLGLKFISLLLIIMAFLMCLPIPLTNTLPAMVIFLIGVGILEEDGFIIFLASVVGCIALLAYTFVIAIFINLAVLMFSYNMTFSELWGHIF